MADEVTQQGSTIDDAAAAIFGLLKSDNKAPDTEESETLRDPKGRFTGKAEAKDPEPEPEAEATEDEPSEEANPDNAEVEGETKVETAKEEEPAKAAKATEREEKAIRDAERKSQEADAVKNQYLNQLSTVIPRLEASLAGEFSDIKSFEDLEKVATEDPARYNRYVINAQKLQAAKGELQRVTSERQGEWYQAEQATLAKKLPDIADPVKGPALKAKLSAFAKEQGYTDELLAMASARDVLTLHDAMRFREAQKAQGKAQEKAAKAPQVQKPGARREANPDAPMKDAFGRLQKSGRIDDAAAVFAAMKL